METLTDNRTKKPVVIKKAYIRVAVNNLTEEGYFADLRVVAVLPGCRTSRIITFSPTASGIWMKSLFSAAGNAFISSAEWLSFIESLDFLPCNLFPYTPSEQEKKDIKNSWGQRMVDSVDAQISEGIRWAMERDQQKKDAETPAQL